MVHQSHSPDMTPDALGELSPPMSPARVSLSKRLDTSVQGAHAECDSSSWDEYDSSNSSSSSSNNSDSHEFASEHGLGSASSRGDRDHRLDDDPNSADATDSTSPLVPVLDSMAANADAGYATAGLLVAEANQQLAPNIVAPLLRALGTVLASVTDSGSSCSYFIGDQFTAAIDDEDATASADDAEQDGPCGNRDTDVDHDDAVSDSGHAIDGALLNTNVSTGTTTLANDKKPRNAARFLRKSGCSAVHEWLPVRPMSKPPSLISVTTTITVPTPAPLDVPASRRLDRCR